MKYGTRRLVPVVGSVALVAGMLGAIIAMAPSSSALTPSTTAIISANPPAASPTTSVTWIAQVTGTGGTPTGTVTFTYNSVGGKSPAHGTIGTAPLNANGEAQVTGSLPTQNIYHITASYSGDGTFAASSAVSTYIVDTTCNENPWPAETNGYPPVQPGSPDGFYIGQSNGYWTIYTAHSENDKTVKFSGTITTDGRIIDVTALKNEKNDHVSLKANDELTFTFHTMKSLDAVEFFAGCGSTLNMGFSITGPGATTVNLYVGNPTTTLTDTPSVQFNR